MENSEFCLLPAAGGALGRGVDLGLSSSFHKPGRKASPFLWEEGNQSKYIRSVLKSHFISELRKQLQIEFT